MVASHRITDDTGRFLVRTGGLDVLAVQREQDPAMHGLEAVAGVGEGTGDDDAQGIGHEGGAELLHDGSIEHEARTGREGSGSGSGTLFHG
jgi:hypothetical protein